MMFFKSGRSNGSGIEFYSPVSDSGNTTLEQDMEDTGCDSVEQMDALYMKDEHDRDERKGK